MSEGKKGIPIWVWILLAAPIALVGFGMLAALAIFGVRKYLANAKQAEARTALASWSAGLARCGEREGQLPPSSLPVPLRLSDLSGKTYKSSAADWSQLAHSCAGFAMTQPQYFQYEWELRTPTEGVAHAIADLDGDGISDNSVGVGVICNAGTCRAGPVMGIDEMKAGSAAPTPGNPVGDAVPPHPAGPTSQGPAGAPPPGSAVDLSTVMGRARKLADGWQREATLLGIEATLVDGKIQTQNGAAAKLTFGPSPFNTTPTRSGNFVVVYDKSGITGVPTPGAVGKALPEPMCAPERVFSRLTNVGEGPFTLRYAFDDAGRPLWMANSRNHPKDVSLFDAQDCSVRGLVGPRNKR